MSPAEPGRDSTYAQDSAIAEGEHASKVVLSANWTHRGIFQARLGSQVVFLNADLKLAVQGNALASHVAQVYAKACVRALERLDDVKQSDLCLSPLLESLWFQLERECPQVPSRQKRWRQQENHVYDYHEFGEGAQVMFSTP